MEEIHSSSEEDLQDNVQQQLHYITDAQQFLQFSRRDKKIKVMDECNPIWNNVYLKDISLHKKGPLEDKIYAKINKYYCNIRRGNTLCQLYHPLSQGQKQTYDLFFCRRGMKKFYDLEPEYFKTGLVLSTHHRLMRQRIFQQLDADIQKGGAQIHLYRLFKQNGEHCQVSYVRQLNCWLFASKNVAILARTPQDLQNHYHKERFYWAKLVGQQFFASLHKFSQQQRESFKRQIEGFTLLGEHCGNHDHQHITRYDKVQIIFYGLVNNVGVDHCQPVEECKSFLNRYGLKMANTTQRKDLVDKNSVYANMWEMLKQVAQGTMAVEGEGSVMYIVSERNGKQRTIGMCKLKTSEYLIYRKLREMLKLNVARRGATANTFDKFKFQIEQLISQYFKPPKPLQFYLSLGSRAFKEAANNSVIDEIYLRYKFVDFMQGIQKQLNSQTLVQKAKATSKRILVVSLPRLSNSLQKYCRSQGYEIDYMFRLAKNITVTTVHILYMIPRLPAKLDPDTFLVIANYQQNSVDNCAKQLGECKDLSKSYLITFIKSEDKVKSVNMLNDKICAFRKSCLQQKIPFISVQEADQEGLIKAVISLTEQQSEALYSKSDVQGMTLRKYFVLPMVIPGSGKSTLAKQLLASKSASIKWKVISSDQIRRQLMQQISEVDLDSQSSQQLFFSTKQQAQSKFQRDLQQQIERIPSGSNEFIYIDRVFSPFNIQKTISDILSASKSYIKVVILTQTYHSVKLNDISYPYSLNYLLVCLRRCLQRDHHQTMSNNPYDVVKIVLRFYQKLANFNQRLLLKIFQDKIGIVHLPLVQQTEDDHFVNQHLKRKIQQCLSFMQPGKQTKQGSHFLQLIQLLYKFGQSKDSSSTQRYTQLKTTLQTQILRLYQ